jgi:hypothetical protein
LEVKTVLLCSLERVSHFRVDENLFVQYSGPRKGQKTAKDTLVRWIKTVILEAYSAEGKEPPFPLKAHSTRATSTSWPERAQVPLSDICNAASWTSSSTFVKQYRLNTQSGQSFSSAVLSAALDV